MRVSIKLALLDNIGRELQQRYTFGEIDAFLAEYQIPMLREHERPDINSKRLYAVARLKGVSNETIMKVAEELGLEIARASRSAAILPQNWQGDEGFRLFISHISKDKDKATRLKECLRSHAISAFVAHEDIHPTLVWQPK